MAISTSVTQLVLPGFDTTVQNNMNAAINTNTAILAILGASAISTGLNTSITSINTLNTSINNLPNSEPLPTWSVYSNQGNNPGYTTYDSDFQPIGGGMFNTSTELGQYWAGELYTNSYRTSETLTSYWVGSTSLSQQQDGHYYLEIPGGENGSYDNGFAKARNYVINTYPYYGTVVNAIGVRMKNSIYFNNQTVGWASRGAQQLTEYLGINSSTYSTWTGGQGYGQIGYNDRTRTLVVLESKDGSNNYRIHVWRNTNAGRSLQDKDMETGRLHLFMSEAKTAGTPASYAIGLGYFYNDFTWTSSGSTSWNESRYRMRLTVGDNNYIGLSRYVPSNQTNYATFLPTPTTTSGTISATLASVACTTSYGMDQDANYYSMRSNITWDNQWIASYNQYYYYCAGMNVIFSNTADPRNYYTGQYATSSGPLQLVPVRQDKFLCRLQNQNSDGATGCAVYMVDLGGAFYNGLRPDGNTISNGQDIGIVNYSQSAWMFDTASTSTNYPIIVSPDAWSNG